MHTRLSFAAVCGAMSLVTFVLPAHADFVGTLDSSAPSVAITLPISQIDSSNTFRMRSRPELLMAEWDAVMDDALSTLKGNPLYQSSGTSGDNPLHKSELFVITVPTITLGYLHKDGIVHRDIAARMLFSAPGESTPLLIADLFFKLPDEVLPGSTSFEDFVVPLGSWQTFPATATLTLPDGSATSEPVTIQGSFSFSIVPAPSAGAVMLGLGALAGRRRR